MATVKIILLALVLAFLCYYLKSINSNLFIPALLASSIFLLGYSLSYLLKLTAFFDEILANLSIDKSIVLLLIKICIIGYVFEFGAGLIDELGIKNLSDKLVFVGKIILLCMSLPIFKILFELLLNFTI